MGWDDRTFDRMPSAPSYPFIQWVNDGSSLEPRSDSGGFAMPVEQMNALGRALPGEICLLRHRNGASTEVLFSPALELAVLETRFGWTMNGQMFRRDQYEEGMRGKLQALCLVRDPDGHTVGPVLLTFTGTAGRQFGEATRAQREVVRKATGGKAPAWAFFGRYQAGGVEMVGKRQQSVVTSLVLGVDPLWDPNRNYIGDALVDAFDSARWQDIDAWKAAWEGEKGERGESNGVSAAPVPAPSGSGSGNGAGRVLYGSEEDDSFLPASAPAPASAPSPQPVAATKTATAQTSAGTGTMTANSTQLALIRLQLTRLGIATQELQDQYLAAKGIADVERMSLETAGALIGELQQAVDAAKPQASAASAPTAKPAPSATHRPASPAPSQSGPAPATAQQMAAVRNLLTQLGYRDNAAQNEALRKAGYDNPDSLSTSQASDAITRLQAAVKKTRSAQASPAYAQR